MKPETIRKRPPPLNKPVASGDGLLDAYFAVCASGSSRNSSSSDVQAYFPELDREAFVGDFYPDPIKW